MTHGALVALRSATEERHRRLEASLPLLSPSLTLDGYRRLLGRFLGLVAPLEAQLDADPPIADWPERRKAHLLAADLGTSGSPACPDPPDVAGPDRGLGCLYVLEGSTLGGRHVAAALTARFGPDVPARYFRSYGEEVGARWRSFRTAVAQRADGGGDVTAMVGAACDTFDAFERWVAR